MTTIKSLHAAFNEKYRLNVEAGAALSEAKTSLTDAVFTASGLRGKLVCSAEYPRGIYAVEALISFTDATLFKVIGYPVKLDGTFSAKKHSIYALRITGVINHAGVTT